MILMDYHTHTTFSDGDNSAEEMVLAAIVKQMTDIGISDHSYTYFDEEYCIPKVLIQEYKNEITRLKQKYEGQINVWLGIEQDYFSTEPCEDYDYVIGSVHYLKKGDEILPFDDGVDCFKELAQKFYGGDYMAMCEAYFETIGCVLEKTGADFVGHFDLICKYNETEKLFDESDERYVAAWKKAALKLIEQGAVFEINTGDMSKGRKTVPYPSPVIQDFIRAHGGEFILSSDSHNTKTLCSNFEKFEI